jgi:hypothetical protein
MTQAEFDKSVHEEMLRLIARAQAEYEERKSYNEDDDDEEDWEDCEA